MASSRVIDRDRGFKAFIRGLKQRRHRGAVGVKVGVTADEDARLEGDSNVRLATIHEFGAPKANIPERSFIRATVDTHRKKYEKALKKAEEAAIKNPRTGSQLVKARLFQLGETAVADIQDRIDSNIPPPLADATVASKGDDLALVDTGELRGAINSKLVGF